MMMMITIILLINNMMENLACIRCSSMYFVFNSHYTLVGAKSSILQKRKLAHRQSPVIVTLPELQDGK